MYLLKVKIEVVVVYFWLNLKMYLNFEILKL